MILADLPLHPGLAHLPIGLSFVLPLMTLSVAFAIARTWLPRGAWLLVVMLAGLMTGTGLVTKETGEQEEHRLNNPALEQAIHQHEEAAEWFIISAVAITLLAVATTFVKNPRAFNVLAFAVGVLAFWPMSVALMTGHHGGSLVFEHGAGQVKATPVAGP